MGSGAAADGARTLGGTWHRLAVSRLRIDALIGQSAGSVKAAVRSAGAAAKAGLAQAVSVLKLTVERLPSLLRWWTGTSSGWGWQEHISKLIGDTVARSARCS